MPSASLQSRINAFEALAVSQSPSSPPTKTVTLSSASVASRRPRHGTSNLLDTPSTNTLQPVAALPTASSSSGSRSPSPTLCRNMSLVDLRDWVVEDGPFGGSPTLCQAASSSDAQLPNVLGPSKIPPRARNASTPLINLDSPPKQRPPLPPRKPSSVAAGGSPVSRTPSIDGDSAATLRPPGFSGSLAIEHTYPPTAHKFGTARVGHAPASSISSFHSISLSFDGINPETHSEGKSTLQDGRSVVDMDFTTIVDSFEELLATPNARPSGSIPFRWESAPQICARPNAPVIKVPPLSSARSTSTSSSSTTTAKVRRPPPPAPPCLPRPRPPSSRASLTSTSDRSSILSTVTTTSRTSVSTRSSTVGANAKVSSLHRPTPVPPAARKRYDNLFVGAILGQWQSEKQYLKSTPVISQPRKGRQAAGWRGLSLDLLAQSEDHPMSENKNSYESTGDSDKEDEPVGAEVKLNGYIIKYIWKASRLDRKKLRDIWNECDPQQTGSLDRDAFAQGMWRIDEELRRAELARCTSALSAASSQRIPHRPLPRSSGTHHRLLT
ncbi:hypothetical protein V8B97DRAFT_2015845 [Scleroderma yunnanense]